MTFSETAVIEMLLKLKPDPMVLRECAEAVAKPPAMIYQKSFDEGVVPENWKEANVSPVFKKGKRADAGNYRPVSLTSVPCKVMESIVRDTLLHYFEKQDLAWV